jgi:hypothetical protein
MSESSVTGDGMQPFTLTMEWGQEDEGLYHWSGRACDIEHAAQLAREEIDCSYNEEYGYQGAEARGIEGGEETTEYVISDYISGVNEFAAGDMLDALRLIARNYQLADDHKKVVEHAIARGEGRA